MISWLVTEHEGEGWVHMTYKIDTNDELSLATAVALHFGSWVSAIRSDGAGRLRRRRITLRSTSISRRASLQRRRATSHVDGRRIAGDRGSPGVDGRGTTDHLRRRRAGRALVRQRAGPANGTGRAWRVVCGVAGRPWSGTWVIHLRETLLGRVGGDGGRRTWARLKELR